VAAAWRWLAELHDRVVRGIPPLSEAEFAELAGWFRANEERLRRLALPSSLLDVGDGRKTAIADVRWQVGRGARLLGAGELAQTLRQLRERYGEGGP
jgi:hypothetical protein